MSPANLSPSAQRVQAALAARDIDLHVLELSESTRTADDAANAVGCEVGQIAKSLVFRGRQSDAPILFVVSGANRVNVSRVASVVGEKLSKADADFVRLHTGFSIGGVPVKSDLDRAWQDYCGWRVNYDRALANLCELVKAPYAPWSCDRSAPLYRKDGSAYPRPRT